MRFRDKLFIDSARVACFYPCNVVLGLMQMSNHSGIYFFEYWTVKNGMGFLVYKSQICNSSIIKALA